MRGRMLLQCAKEKCEKSDSKMAAATKSKANKEEQTQSATEG